MSDQRPEWMPSGESLLPMCHNESLYDNCEHDYAGEEIEESHYRTGLRAQIAVLEEINDDADSYMDSETGEDAHWAVKQSTVQDKIAALRKELEG